MDWADGRIDGSYQFACYRVAPRSLPTDLHVYSSASEDIAQALSLRIVQSAEERMMFWPRRKSGRTAHSGRVGVAAELVEPERPCALLLDCGGDALTLLGGFGHRAGDEDALIGQPLTVALRIGAPGRRSCR
jgi:hypothetical protein